MKMWKKTNQQLYWKREKVPGECQLRGKFLMCSGFDHNHECLLWKLKWKWERLSEHEIHGLNIVLVFPIHMNSCWKNHLFVSFKSKAPLFRRRWIGGWIGWTESTCLHVQELAWSNCLWDFSFEVEIFSLLEIVH